MKKLFICILLLLFYSCSTFQYVKDDNYNLQQAKSIVKQNEKNNKPKKPNNTKPKFVKNKDKNNNHKDIAFNFY